MNYEEEVSNFAAPMKMKYYPRETAEFAERGYVAAIKIAHLTLELCSEIRQLNKKVEELERLIKENKQ